MEILRDLTTLLVAARDNETITLSKRQLRDAVDEIKKLRGTVADLKAQIVYRDMDRFSR